jgi:hypothetical protein
MAEYLITFNDEWVAEHTPEELAAKAAAGRAVITQMQADGVLIFCNGALDRSSVVGHAVARDGGAEWVEGPFVETEQHVGGFAIVDAPDDTTARRWAERLAVALDWPQEVQRFRGPGHRARP